MTQYTVRLCRYGAETTRGTATTWTSISDIGKSFDDGVLTLERYLRTESAYLEAVRLVYRDAGNPPLSIRDLELPAPGLSEGATVEGEAVLEVVRMMLREETSCRLVADDVFFVHAGFDYYVYIGSTHLQDVTITKIESLGLRIQHGYPSPYDLP